MSDTTNETPQQVFDRTYITSQQIANELELSRTSIFAARKRGQLPHPIIIDSQTFIWERTKVEPILKAWKNSLQFRKGNLECQSL